MITMQHQHIVLCYIGEWQNVLCGQNPIITSDSHYSGLFPLPDTTLNPNLCSHCYLKTTLRSNYTFILLVLAAWARDKVIFQGETGFSDSLYLQVYIWVWHQNIYWEREKKLGHFKKKIFSGKLDLIRSLVEVIVAGYFALRMIVTECPHFPLGLLG